MKISGKLAEKGLHAFDGEPRTHAGIPIPRVWIVVADREKAYIYRKTPKEIERIADVHSGHAESHPEEAGSGGTVHHGYDVRSEKRHHNDSAFLQKLAAWIDKAVAEDAVDKLVFTASPHTLGDIRTLLDKKTQTRIVTEIDKDWIKLPEKEIEAHLVKVTWF